MLVAESFERCIAAGGVAVFPADTVYGLACDPTNAAAVGRLYALKRRSLDKPSAVMFFELESAFAALPELGERTRWALSALLPGGVSFVVPNPRGRFPLACGADKSALGVRVPAVAQLAGVGGPVLQSSANLAGGADPVALGDVPAEIRTAADLVIDGGVLPGTPSTVIDLREYERGGDWQMLREGAVPFAEVAARLGGQFHFDPAGYLELIRAEVPRYDELQDEVARASGTDARRILELGTGTGETAGRLLERHPAASLVGIDASASMLERARDALPRDRAQLLVSRLEDPLPPGPYDLVVSALCVHHLPGRTKADLFARVASVLAARGRFVLADVVEPADGVGAAVLDDCGAVAVAGDRAGGVASGKGISAGVSGERAGGGVSGERAGGGVSGQGIGAATADDRADVRTPLSPGYDFPSPVADQVRWLGEAGLTAHVTWSSGDLAVIVADAR